VLAEGKSDKNTATSSGGESIIVAGELGLLRRG
jgi:hypothetical protein